MMCESPHDNPSQFIHIALVRLVEFLHTIRTSWWHEGTRTGQFRIGVIIIIRR